jgi:hypothetical protein
MWEDEGCRKSMLTVQKLETQRFFRLIISETARVTEGSTGCPGVSLFSKPLVPNVLRRKGKVLPCRGTEALYRAYGPYGE